VGRLHIDRRNLCSRGTIGTKAKYKVLERRLGAFQMDLDTLFIVSHPACELIR
jgi:hypothetical protein